MAVIQNQKIIQKLIDELELYPALDKVPTELAEKILPTFQVNTQEVITKNPPSDVVRFTKVAAAAGASDTTIYTTPATGKFYLTNVFLDFVKEHTSVNFVDLEVVIGGETISLLTLRCETTTSTLAQKNASLNLQNPILIDPATNIVLARGNTDDSAGAVIIGFTEE